MKYFRHIGKAWKDYGLMAGLFALAIAVIGGLYWIVLTRGMGKEQYTVWVIQSNESGYKPYGIYGQQLTSSLRKKGIHAKINTFYLNCEQYFERDEINRMDSAVSSWTGRRRPDLIIVNGDQATYSLLSTYNPLLREVPIVFGAVRFPNKKLLDKYAPYHNITGLHDSIDIPANLRFIRELTQCGRVITQIDDSFLDRQTLALADRQLARHPEIINNLHWDYPLAYIRKRPNSILTLTSLSLRHSERMASEKEVEWRQKSVQSEEVAMAERKVQGAQNYFFMMNKFGNSFNYLLLKNESGSRVIVGMVNAFLFTALDENFDMGPDSKVIGGYFTTWEMTAEKEAELARRILVDKVQPGLIPVQVSPKEYVVDWNAHDMKGRERLFQHLPSYVKVINIPFKESHPMAYLAIVHGAGTLGVLLIIYLFVLYRRELRRRRQTYGQQEEERENLSLSILGSRTYAWVAENGKAKISEEFFRDTQLAEQIWDVNHNRGLWFIVPEYRERFINFVKEQRSPGQHTFQCEYDFGNGEPSWWEIRCTTLITPEGQRKTVGLLIDISDIKRREQELDVARQKAVESERIANEARRLAQEVELKQSFIENMSHEIRTPLNAIVGFSTLIAQQHDELSDDEMAAFVEDIEHNTSLLLQLVNDVVELSQIESGDMKFEFKEVNVAEWMDNVYQVNHFQIPNHLQFVLKKGAGNPRILVDEKRLQHVLNHLITNACKFTPQGTITLGWEVCRDTGEVALYVEDTGIGISEAEQRLVFGRFYKSDEFKQGTGLGLSLSKVIVERLHGRIELESEVGKGSRFTVILQRLK